MKEVRIITHQQRFESEKSIGEWVAENRDWMLGPTGLNGWEWFVDIHGNINLHTLTLLSLGKEMVECSEVSRRLSL